MLIHAPDGVSTICRVFGRAPIERGQIVSAHEEKKYTVATKYDGTNVFGIALNNVVDIDLHTTAAFNLIVDGGLFDVLIRGYINVPKRKRWKIGTLLTVRAGELVAASKHARKIYGMVIKVGYNWCMIDFWTRSR